MKSKISKFEMCCAALQLLGCVVWMLLRRCFARASRSDDVQREIFPEMSALPRLSPLDCIAEHLGRLGLGQQVRVRLEIAGEGFILEDNDGLVHAKDYNEALLLIDRIWLYMP